MERSTCSISKRRCSPTIGEEERVGANQGLLEALHRTDRNEIVSLFARPSKDALAVSMAANL